MVTLNNINNSLNNGEVYEMKISKPLRDQERYLPISNITKMMKKILPADGKVN